MRPVSNRKVTYSLGKDELGRHRAGRFPYVGAARVGICIAPGFWLAAAFVLAFFAALGRLLYLNYLPVTIMGAYGVGNLVAFVMYWIDKRAATLGAQRTPENTLHIFELLCALVWLAGCAHGPAGVPP